MNSLRTGCLQKGALAERSACRKECLQNRVLAERSACRKECLQKGAPAAQSASKRSFSIEFLIKLFKSERALPWIDSGVRAVCLGFPVNLLENPHHLGSVQGHI